jgi:carbon-monoxide dehydrogenase medium subunit
VKPAPFDYARPDSLAEALELLGQHPEAKVLAGGQSLVPLLSMRLAAPAMLVDINAITELSYVRAEPTLVRVGALARHADVETDVEARRVQPLLHQALRLVAHPTIRNRGTTVGSIVHADAAAETPAVLSLLGGTLTAASTQGRREIAASELFVGPLQSSLRPGELAVEAAFPALSPTAGVAIQEVARRHGDYALCGVTARVEMAGGEVTAVRAGYFSVCDVPTVVDLGPAFPDGITEASLADAAELALPHLDPAEDIHATAAYRVQLVRTLTARVVRAAHEHARARAREAAA